MKKMIRGLALLACLLVLSVMIGDTRANAASNITALSATGSTQGVTVSGTTDEDVAAVLIEILDGTDIVTLETHAVTGGKFSATLSCALTTGKTYKVYVINYNGSGTAQETTVSLPTATPTPTAVPTPTTAPTPTATPTPTAVPTPTSTPVPTKAPEEEDPTGGKLQKDTVIAKDAPVEDAGIENTIAELIEAKGIFTEEEKKAILNGEEAKVFLEVKDIDVSDITSEQKNEVEEAAKKELGGKAANIVYMDISLYKQVGSQSAAGISEPGIKLEISVKLPDELKNTRKDVVRQYRIIRIHDGAVEIIPCSFNSKTGEVTFHTDKFSTYAIVYTDVKADIAVTTSNDAMALNSGIKFTQPEDFLFVKWGEVAEADGYLVYVAKCGEAYGKDVIAVEAGKNGTIKLTNVIKTVAGEAINTKGNYKAFVEAYKLEDGERVTIAKSIEVHTAGKDNTKYTNAKGVNLISPKVVTVKVGKTDTIKAEIILQDEMKELLSESHAKKLRFRTTNPSVAAVNADGKILAKKKGSCYIYIYAQSGRITRVKVNVK